MYREKQDTLEWLEFDLLRGIPRVQHAVFLRHGGFSSAPFDSLNTSFSVGDSDEHVASNIKKIKTLLQRQVPGWNSLVFGKGIHQTSIALVGADSPTHIPDVDGVMTATPGVSLLMTHADCQVALFYDPVNHAAACVHAGWRGNILRMYKEAIKHMKQNFGSKPENILVCISPSLGPEKGEFINYKTEWPEEFWCFQHRPTFFDLWAIAESELRGAGILLHHIEIAKICTWSKPQDFFSFRRDHAKCGRNATCITLLP